MASGKVHEIVTLAAAPIVGAATFRLTGDLVLSACVSAGVLSGIILSPDLDLSIRTLSERRAMMIPLFGHLFCIWSAVYAALINNGRAPFVHRGISHWPVIGTLTRWLFFFALPALVIGYATNNVEPVIRFVQANQTMILAAFAGAVLADVLHGVLDAI